jgi:hypothetical protein
MSAARRRPCGTTCSKNPVNSHRNHIQETAQRFERFRHDAELGVPIIVQDISRHPPQPKKFALAHAKLDGHHVQHPRC